MTKVLARASGLLIHGCVWTVLLLSAAGCTSRGLTITSNPPGAEISINHRVVGVTPLRVGFEHYGTYRIELRKEHYQVLVKEAAINPPIYGYDPPAFFADNIIPARLNDELYLHYVLTPIGNPPAGDEIEKDSDGNPKEQADGGNTSPPFTPKVPTPEEAAAKVSARDALLARAELARGGTTTTKAGSLVQVDLKRPVPGQDKVAAATTATSADGTATAAVPAASPLSLNPELGLVKEIVAKPPEGPRLANELGLETPAVPDATKQANFLPPTGSAASVSAAPLPPVDDTKKPADTVVRRVPKDEELVFDRPVISDPNQKKDDKKKKVETPKQQADDPAKQ